MASVKIKFRASTVAGKDGVLYFQVIHNRVVRQINTHKAIAEKEWDCRMCRVKIPLHCDNFRREYLENLRRYLDRATECFGKILLLLDESQSYYDADDIVKEYRSREKGQTLREFIGNIVPQLRKSGRYRTAETYQSAINSFMRFRSGRDIGLNELTSEMMRGYQLYLISEGLSMNSISFYMRILRAAYNRAVDGYIVEQRRPFKWVYTGVERTAKRAVPMEVIRKIKNADLSMSPMLDWARDLFMFSFYTRGMSFIDIAYLRKENLVNGVLTYRRHKTGQQLSVRWERCMQDIVDKYDTSNTPYILPVVKDADLDERKQYRKELFMVNRRLKRVARRIGLSVTLTMYVARHSWASIAKSQDIPVAVISDAMGHDSELTTQIYLAAIDSGIIDRANEIVLSHMR